MIQEREEIPFARPFVGDEELRAVERVFKSGWLTTGPECEAFEAEFSDRVNATGAVSVSSGTAALELSLVAAGVTRGDVVVTSNYNFVSAIEVTVRLGGIPAVVDVDEQSLNLDPELLDRVVRGFERQGRRVRAIIPVHLAGHPAPTLEYAKVAKRCGAALIEDAAHAFGATDELGRIGSDREATSATCFSFYANKPITTGGEGGMVTSADREFLARIRRLRLHGTVCGSWERESTSALRLYDFSEPGHKANLTDLQAAIGRAQLSRAARWQATRARTAQSYLDLFDAIPWIDTHRPMSGTQSSWHLFIIRLREEAPLDRDQLAQRLVSAGVQVGHHYRPLSEFRVFRPLLLGLDSLTGGASRSSKRALSLPLVPEAVDRVRDCVEVIGTELNS